ncbi:MAG: tetratricopeptide repeat protein [Terriglobales bacterium]
MTSFSSAAAAPKRMDAPPSSAPALFRSPRQRTLLLCLLLTVFVLAFYNPVTHNRFIRFDDDGYITDNPEVRAGLTWETVKWSFTTYQQANWHPLTWLSHALDCELFGLNPAGPHYVNVLLHAVNAILLFLLLQSATGFRWRSFIVAALFALHPINVESVAWAAERKNVLSTLFFLLALYAYGEYVRRPGVWKYSAVAGFFALALLTKPQVITFPLLLLLWDYWPLGRMGAIGSAEGAVRGWAFPKLWDWRLVLEKVPLLLLSAASAVITMKAQKAGGAIQTFTQFNMPVRLETAVVSYVRYIGKAFWPTQLEALYPHPTQLYPAWQALAAVVGLLLVTAWVLRARDQRYLAVGWFWFLGSLVPMIGLVQVGNQAMADRYAYTSFIGLFLMTIWFVGNWAQANHISGKWLALPAIACLLVLGIGTYRQVGYWHDTESMWRRTLAVSPENYVAQVNLGEFLMGVDKGDEAAEHFREAVRIRPEGLTASLNLGAYEDHRGNLAAAIERYQLVAQKAGDSGMRATAYGSLGFVYRQMGQSEKAKQSFETALQVAPGRSRAIVGLGLIAQDKGDLAEAVRQYSLALSAEASDVTYVLLANALQRQGRMDEAKAIYQRLAATSPDFAEAQHEAQALLSGK